MKKHYYLQTIDFLSSKFRRACTGIRLSAAKGSTVLENVSIRDKIIATVIIAVLIPMGISTYISGKIVADRIEAAYKDR